MRKIVTVAAMATVGAVVAKGYRDRYLPGPIPAGEELDLYFDDLFEMLGIPGLRSAIEEDHMMSDGLRLHLDLFLSGPEDPALVFIPGTSVYALFYAEFMHKMRQSGFNVIGLDPRGHGRSEGRRGSYTVSELVSDARAATDYAIDRFGDRVAICGSSQGGITAFYAAASDNRLKAAVCHNIAVLGGPGAFGLTRYPRLMALASHLLPLTRLAPEVRVPVTTYLDLEAESTRFGKSAMEFMKADPLAVMSIALKALASLASTPLPHPIEEIRVPVMVIQAEHDNIFDESYVRGIYDRLTCEREFLLVPGAPHLVMTNDVDTIVPRISAWLSRFLLSD